MKIKGIYFLYRALQALALPALLLYFLYRVCTSRGYWRSLPERFGFLPRSLKQTASGSIWLHAVSVGEALACLEFLRQLRLRFPHTAVFVSTSTIAGRAAADQKMRGLADGIFFCPVDYAFAVRRVLRTLQPSLVLIVETEIWPNLFREVKRTGAGLGILNARISEDSYPRYRAWRQLFEAALPAADFILAQTSEIRERFIAIGAPAARVRVAGNFKHDFEPREAAPDSPVRLFLDQARPSAVWIAASTVEPAMRGDPDEDDAVIGAFREVAARHAGLLLLLAPRKPERFDAAARKLEAAGVPYVRRSGLPVSNAPVLPEVLLLDSIGELSGLFAFADVVFMGGSLARRGGHNILEPALFAKPVIFGRHMENFQETADEFREAGACVEIASAAELAGAVEDLIAEPEAAAAIGRLALACAQSRRGATRRAIEEAAALYSRSMPAYRPAMPWFAAAWALALLWKWGTARKQSRDLARRRKLDVPVISVGNITMGGTGKTPCVVHLAEALKQRGARPGFLTRGYGRQSPELHLILSPGAPVAADRCGDEALILVGSALAPVGVGANRFDTGVLLRRQYDVDSLLLDDGFQHLRLGRDLDIVLLDALDPFGGGYLFPLGRLREPLEGLARAGIILITRSHFSDLPEAIEKEARRWNSRAPIFRAHIRPRAWVEHRSGREINFAERPFTRAGAFCGLGNPQSFRRVLAGLGVDPADWLEFEDHHKYRARELRRITLQFATAGADALVTTEKDAVNLPEDADALVKPLSLYWLKIAFEIERESEFLAELERRIVAAK